MSTVDAPTTLLDDFVCQLIVDKIINSNIANNTITNATNTNTSTNVISNISNNANITNIISNNTNFNVSDNTFFNTSNLPYNFTINNILNAENCLDYNIDFKSQVMDEHSLLRIVSSDPLL